MRTLFATQGLLLELLGGLMLSLELVWSVNAFVRPLNWFHDTLEAIRGSPHFWVMWTTTPFLLFSAGASLSEYYLSLVRLQEGPLNLEPDPAIFPPELPDPVIWLAEWLAIMPWWQAGLIAVAIPTAIFALLTVAILLIRTFLSWVGQNEEVRTRRLAQVGFVLLLMGFTFQGIVNFMPL